MTDGPIIWGERTLAPDPEVFKRLERKRYEMLRDHVYWGMDFDALLAERGYRFDHEEGKLVELDRTDNPPGDDEVGDLRT